MCFVHAYEMLVVRCMDLQEIPILIKCEVSIGKAHMEKTQALRHSNLYYVPILYTGLWVLPNGR